MVGEKLSCEGLLRRRGCEGRVVEAVAAGDGVPAWAMVNNCWGGDQWPATLRLGRGLGKLFTKSRPRLFCIRTLSCA